jgi:aryl-alcohol dehydrogenase-like predicted oxidoreductase
MDYRKLGRTGLRVSPLCLGTMNFGPQSDEATSFAIMDRALDLGINFFDTANVYGGKKGEGVTEQIVGRWLAQGDGRREQIVLATKVYGRMGDRPNENLLSAHHLRHACDESLRRLKTDHIDLYQMHHVDRSTPWDEIWQAMEQLVSAGKVIYVGSSNFAGWHLALAQGTAARRNFVGLVSEQSLYNLNARTIELEVVPACRGLGLGLLPWSPLAGGLLTTGADRTVNGRRATDQVAKAVEKYKPRLDAYTALCRDLGAAPADVALAWLLANPVVTSPIIGPRTVEQLEDSLRALDLELAPAIMKRLDEIFPGPGGEAPEAYAW